MVVDLGPTAGNRTTGSMMRDQIDLFQYPPEFFGIAIGFHPSVAASAFGAAAQQPVMA
ncbi:MAG TPA: hypothetical protein VL475_02070 [Planctomycetaceae bacterium]|nr:hypothetical protein [Planctomycetaceae bacterium]